MKLGDMPFRLYARSLYLENTQEAKEPGRLWGSGNLIVHRP